jgi:hypothetical protein
MGADSVNSICWKGNDVSTPQELHSAVKGTGRLDRKAHGFATRTQLASHQHDSWSEYSLIPAMPWRLAQTADNEPIVHLVSVKVNPWQAAPRKAQIGNIDTFSRLRYNGAAVMRHMQTASKGNDRL